MIYNRKKAIPAEISKYRHQDCKAVRTALSLRLKGCFDKKMVLSRFFCGRKLGKTGVISGYINYFAPNTLCKSSVVRLAGFRRIAASSLAI